MITRGEVTKGLEDITSNKIKSKSATGKSPGFNTARLEASKLEIQEEGQLKVTSCCRAGGEHTRLTHFGLISIELISMTSIRRKNRNEDAVIAGEG